MWGYEKPDGNFTAMIGHVQRGDADFSANGCQNSIERLRAVDFLPTLKHWRFSSVLIRTFPLEEQQIKLFECIITSRINMIILINIFFKFYLKLSICLLQEDNMGPILSLIARVPIPKDDS